MPRPGLKVIPKSGKVVHYFRALVEGKRLSPQDSPEFQLGYPIFGGGVTWSPKRVVGEHTTPLGMVHGCRHPVYISNTLNLSSQQGRDAQTAVASTGTGTATGAGTGEPKAKRVKKGKTPVEPPEGTPAEVPPPATQPGTAPSSSSAGEPGGLDLAALLADARKSIGGGTA
jgi:hypothetical protein